jgi:hypothetical protein
MVDLAAARERAGLSEEAIAAATKLPAHTIHDIEQGRFEDLPRGVLGRGHVRAYARAVGLDEDAVVALYLRQRFGGEPETLPIALPPPAEPERHPGRLLVAHVTFLALAGTIVYEMTRRASGGPAVAEYEMPRRTPQGPAVPELMSHGRIGLPVALGAEPVVVPEPTELRLDVEADGPCWVWAMADEVQVFVRLLQTGDRATVTARETLVLRVGAPEAFVYSLNGRPGLPLGDAGRPVTVEITMDNYRTFLDDTEVVE